MNDLTYWVRGQVRQGYGLFLAFALLHCGGAMVGDGTGGMGSVTPGDGGAGGSGSSASTAMGGMPTKPTTTATGPILCTGVVPSAADFPCIGYDDEVGPFEEQDAECSFSYPVPAGYRINPVYVRLFFSVDMNGKLEIPYVGGIVSCPTNGTAGGWYMTTDAAKGTTKVGLCGCTCLAAKEWPVTLTVSCDGLGSKT